MENTNTNILTIKENDFEKIYFELLNYADMLRGFLATGTICDLLNFPSEELTKSEVFTINGFAALLNVIDDNLEFKLNSFYDYFEKTRNNKANLRECL